MKITNSQGYWLAERRIGYAIIFVSSDTLGGAMRVMAETIENFRRYSDAVDK